MPVDSGASDEAMQLPFDFESIIKSAQVQSRDQVVASVPSDEGTYDPVDQTSRYMHQVVEAEAQWETTLAAARRPAASRCPPALSGFLD